MAQDSYTSKTENVVFMEVYRAFRSDPSYAITIAEAARKEEEAAA